MIIIPFLVKYKIFIPCIFHMTTNLYCPSCGMTRMILSILKLDFYQAFRYNPLCFVLSPFIIPYIIYEIYIFTFMKEDKVTRKIPKSIFIIIIVALIAFGILRNLNEFSYLAPTIVK